MTAIVIAFVMSIVVLLFLTCVLSYHDFMNGAILCLILLVTDLAVAATVLPCYGMGYMTCKQVAAKMELEYDYGWFTGCMVREHGSSRWFPMEQQRIMK